VKTAILHFSFSVVLKNPGFALWKSCAIAKASPVGQKLPLSTKNRVSTFAYNFSTVGWATVESDRPPQSTLRLASKAHASQQ
jgi:hypothetical protein